MDKLQEMEEQLRKYTGSIDEEGSAKFNEALDYVSTHLTPEVRERMTIFVEEGYEQCRKDILKVINSCEPEKRPEVAERFYNMIMELRNKYKTE
ncbi:MAG: hypothetical protein IKJ92_06420 [Bacteroidaceae bacterium]|nr:hypothetical protein [Bacteroidaceae bacterium]